MAFFDIYDNESKLCPICAEELFTFDEPVPVECFVCGKEIEADEFCRSEHALCEDCRVGSSYNIVKAFCLNDKTTDPLALAIKIMNSPLIKNQGAEHHFIVPAVLLTAIHNKTAQPLNLITALDMAAEKAMETTTRCTYDKGTCGAALGTGIFLSIFSELEEDEGFSIPDSLTAESMLRIYNSPGPRCCKRDTYIAIEETVKFLNEKFAIELPLTTESKCTFSLRNRTCGHEDCNYYNVGLSLV